MANIKSVFPKGRVRGAAVLSTFVSVGNATQPFLRLLKAVETLAPELPQPVTLQHGNTPFQSDRCICVPFMDMEEFERKIAASSLLVLHAGAGAVVHSLSCGKVPVIMPRREKYGEHIDDHQLEFARKLAEEGKVVLAEEADDLKGAVIKASLQSSAVAAGQKPALVSLIGDLLKELEQSNQ
jgi:UDP-N-acetylglucosamine transferase subunit ALG13